ncbi:MAG: hypothetical protein QFB87_01585 [Patescibacteria group bacterium]|nr:hypothetical protein [Patescibacteria group bacterium]
MVTKFRLLQRIAYTMAAIAVLVGVVYPAFKPKLASAAQLTTRSITLSDSGQSGGTITTGVGSGTNVVYKFAFTTTQAAQSLVIDFCNTSPLIGDTCTAPVGMDASAAVLAGITGNITNAGWTVTATASQIKLAKGSGSAATSGVQSFTLSGITNPASVVYGGSPKPVGTFYGRIYTYADSTYGSSSTAYVSPASPGNFMDYGGIALSTNQIITITAKVQEQLTFCVSGAAQATWTTTNDCSDSQAAVAPALILGHGAPTAILDNSATDTGTVYSQISTNAAYGAAIAMRNSNTTCGGLSADGGTTCGIPANNTGAATPAPITTGTAAFGLYVTDGALGTGGIGAVLADLNYNDGTPTHYGMDTETTTDTGSVTGTYGDRVAYTTAPCYRINNSYTFAATASLTTPAGIYTANMDLIATGTF